MSMSRDDMLKFVDDLYTATSVGDFDKASAMLTDDFFITEADSLPMAGVYRGKNALKDLFIEVMGMMDVAGLARGETTTSADTAVCHVTFQFVDPKLTPAELLELFRFRDGKICEIRPYYFDPSTIHAAVAAKASQKH